MKHIKEDSLTILNKLFENFTSIFQEIFKILKRKLNFIEY